MRKLVNRYLQRVNLPDSYLLILLFVILVTLALIPFNNIFFTTNDDFRTCMNTVATSPFSGAVSQGRFQFLYQLPLARVPYLFNNFFIFELIRNLSHVILLIVISYFVYRITKSVKIYLLIFTLFFAWLQNSNTHNLITSYILVFHIPLISIFLALILFEKFSVKPNLKRGSLICLLTFYGISGYESLIFFLALAPFLDRSSIKKFKLRIQIYFPFLVSIVLYLIITFIWKLFFPSHYDGNTLSLSYANIPLALKVCFKFTIAALPAYFYFLQNLHTHNFFELLRNASYVPLIQALVTFLVSAFIMTKAEPDPNVKTGKRRLIALSIVVFSIAFAVNALYGLTSKYRGWVSAGTPAFVSTYFSSLCFAIFFATLITIVLNIVQRKLRPMSRLISIFIIAIGISLVSILIGISNQNIRVQETDMTSKLELVNQFLASDLYGTLNEKDIIVGQALFEGNPGFLTRDWTDYFQYKTGKKINVVKSLNDMKDSKYKRLIDINIIKTDSDPFNNVLTTSEVIPNSNNLEFSKILYFYSNKFKMIQVTRNSKCSIVWEKGFYDLEQTPEHRWSQKDSVLTIVNSNNSPILVQLSGNFYTGHTEVSSVEIKSKLFADVINVNNQGTHWEKTIELPPGNTQIEFATDAKQVDTPKDARKLFFSMNHFTISPIS